jgi:hypothetical protein
MDAVSATVFDGGQVILLKTQRSIEKNISPLQADRGFASLYSHSQVGVVDRDCT